MNLSKTHWYIFTIVLCAYLFFAVLNLVRYPVIHPPDEAAFSSISYSLLSNEKLAEQDFAERLPYSDKTPLTHYGPLYIFSLAIPIKLFGYSIYTIRGYSVFLGLLSLVVFYFLMRATNKFRLFNFMALLLLGTDIFFLNSAKIVRMEILAIFFQLLAYFFYFRTFQKRDSQNYILVGLFVTLAFFTHFVSGIPALLAIGAHSILFNRSFWKNKKSFIVPAVLGGTFVLWWIYLSYFADRSAIAGSTSLFLRRLFPTFVTARLVLNDRQNFIIINIILYSIGFILAVFKKNKTHYDTFWITSALCSLVVAIWGEQWIYLSILSVSFIPLLFLDQNEKKSQTSKNYLHILRFVIVIIFICFNFLQQSIIFDRYRDYSYETYGKEISRCIKQDGARVLMDVIPDPYFYLAANRKDLKLGNKKYPDPDNSLMKQTLTKADYVIVTAAYNSFLNHPDLPLALSNPQLLVQFRRFMYSYYLVKLDFLLYIKEHGTEVCFARSSVNGTDAVAAIYKLR